MKKSFIMATVIIMMSSFGAIGQAKADSLKDKLDKIQISGFVDASTFTSNVNSKTTTGAADASGTGLDQVELDVEYSDGNIGLRFDLQISPSSTATVTNDSLIEQGYITYTLPDLLDDGLTFTYGKFNAPIGWELLDAPDMYQFSHANTFLYFIPTNLIGGMLSGSMGMLDAAVYYTNGADANGTNTSGGMKTYGGRLGITPMEGANLGISYLYDKNSNGANSPASTIIDIDATYTGLEGLTLGGEYNQGKGQQGVTAGVATKSKGWFLVANYALTDMFGVTGRYESADFDTSVAGKTTAYTGALTASLGDGLGALFEARSDKNTNLTAADGNGMPAQQTVMSYAFEMTYAF